MQYHRKGRLDAAGLREDLAAMESQIRSNPGDNHLVARYVAYSRKLREIEYRENGYVTARPLETARHLLGEVQEERPCC
jgi:hypothetical protein